MNSIYQKLGKWGCDVEGALERFINDDDFYISCLSMFVLDENIGIFMENIQKQDYDAAFENAHTIKGVAGNLGLIPIYEVIAEIAAVLKAGKIEDIDVKCKKFLMVFNEFKEIME